MSFEIAQIYIVLFDQIFNSVKGFCFGLKRIVDLDLTQQQRTNDMNFHPLNFFEKLAKHSIIRFNAYPAWGDDIFNQFLFTLSAFYLWYISSFSLS